VFCANSTHQIWQNTHRLRTAPSLLKRARS